jgi:hypothetical protein
MVRLLSSVLISAALVGMSGANCPVTRPVCPIHEYSNGSFVRTDYIDGKRVDTFKCPRGHNFQVVCD